MLYYTSMTLVSIKRVCHERQLFDGKGSRQKDTKEVCQVGAPYGLHLDSVSLPTESCNKHFGGKVET